MAAPKKDDTPKTIKLDDYEVEGGTIILTIHGQKYSLDSEAAYELGTELRDKSNY